MPENTKDNKPELGNRTRMIYIYRYLTEHTDPDHPSTTTELIDRIRTEYGVDVNRTTISDDITALNEAGYRIETIRSRPNKYYYDDRLFETAELKMLIDAISSSKFITEKNSKMLIGKLLSLTSEYERDQFTRHITVEGRVKSDNEKGYYIVDTVNEAIEKKQVISFQYSDYTVEKRKVARHDGEVYYVYPYTMVWDGDYYYLIGWCSNRNDMRHFRLDRISQTPKLVPDRNWVDPPEQFRLSEYLKSVFRMYGSGETVEVDLLCDVSTMKAVIDQFGKDVKTQPVDEFSFKAHVSVCPTPTFFQWVFGWHGKITISGPAEVRKEYREMLKNALDDML